MRKIVYVVLLLFISLSSFSQNHDYNRVEVGVMMFAPRIEERTMDYVASFERYALFELYEYYYIENAFNEYYIDVEKERITFDQAREYIWDLEKTGLLEISYQGMQSIVFDLTVYRINHTRTIL